MIDKILDNYIQALKNQQIYKDIIINKEDSYSILLHIVYYDIFIQNKKNFLEQENLIFFESDDEKIVDLIRNRILYYSKKSNEKFCEMNRLFLLGNVTYYFQEYNLFLGSLILAFLIKFIKKNDLLITQNIEFLMMQKKKDGKIGYINPLNDNSLLDFEEFYKLNYFSYNVIKKLI
ncbi:MULTISPECIES: hypothetical protein [Helcococcus]|uniref:Uncharacterized protein n=1 Tax=Helcococcus bovis TaxID=3153252 RepID=A0ABW9F995_9FIRM